MPPVPVQQFQPARIVSYTRYERHARQSRRACFIFRLSQLPVERRKGPCHIRCRNKSQAIASQGLCLGCAEGVRHNWSIVGSSQEPGLPDDLMTHRSQCRRAVNAINVSRIHQRTGLRSLAFRQPQQFFPQVKGSCLARHRCIRVPRQIPCMSWWEEFAAVKVH